MEAIGTCHLILDIRFHSDLMGTSYEPISLKRLSLCSFKFRNDCFSLFRSTCMIGSGTHCDGLYQVNLDHL